VCPYQRLTMKNQIVLSVSLFTAILFSACSKDQTVAPVTTPPPKTDPVLPVKTINLNVTYPTQTATGTFELIVSEPSGKVLLDSIAAVNTPVITSVQTSASLVDFTYILDQGNVSSPYTRYLVYVYKGVNPSNWTKLNSALSPISYPLSSGPTTASQIFIPDYPSNAVPDGIVSNSFVFDNCNFNLYTNLSYYASANTFNLYYDRHAGHPVYFSITHLGLYKLYTPMKDFDTLDVFHMDTLSTTTFTRKFPFTINYQIGYSFHGIPDTTDLSTSISFSNFFDPKAPGQGDLQYPKTFMQKYEIELTAVDNNNDLLSYYGLVSNIPTDLNLPDPSTFSEVSKEADDISFLFKNPSSTTSCQINLSNSLVGATIWSSPDSTTLHPLTLLTNLKSKMLNGVSLVDITPKNFEFLNIPGYSYADYFSYLFNQGFQNSHPYINTYTGLSRTF
jgi:hypothetical protein